MSENKVIPVFGEPVEVLVPSKDTNYSFCICVQTSPPGGGPPPHKHLKEEEVFMVLEGDYEFFNGEQWTPFRKGELRYSLRGHYHGFRNSGTTEGRLWFMTHGAGIDEYFQEISPLKVPEDMAKLQEISSYYGYVFMPPKG